MFQIEKLYKDLQRCKLSDRYTPTEEPEPAQQPVLQLLPYILIGTVVVLAAVFVLVLFAGKKKKNDDKEQAS